MFGFDDLRDGELVTEGEAALRLGFTDWRQVSISLAALDIPAPQRVTGTQTYFAGDLKRWLAGVEQLSEALAATLDDAIDARSTGAVGTNIVSLEIERLRSGKPRRRPASYTGVRC